LCRQIRTINFLVVTANLPGIGLLLLAILLFEVMAVIALAAHYVFAAAFARADVSALAPVEYTALIWGRS
jgi:hypothetical protein